MQLGPGKAPEASEAALRRFAGCPATLRRGRGRDVGRACRMPPRLAPAASRYVPLQDGSMRACWADDAAFGVVRRTGRTVQVVALHISSIAANRRGREGLGNQARPFLAQKGRITA